MSDFFRPVLKTLKTQLEHAPANFPAPPPDLLGWTTPATQPYWTEFLFVCPSCAGRIMARGCKLPKNSEPVWNDRECDMKCCLCDKNADS